MPDVGTGEGAPLTEAEAAATEAKPADTTKRAETTPPPTGPKEAEGPPPPERTVFSRSEILEALRFARQLFDKVASSRSSDEQWASKTIHDFIDATLDRNKPFLRGVDFNLEGGPKVFKFHQEEGLPVDSLTRFLDQERNDADSKGETDRLQSLEKNFNILWHSSKLYYDVDPLRFSPTRKLARIQYEAYLISQDERNTGTQEGNWKKAEDQLLIRRELILPPEEVKPAPPAKVEAAPPAAVPPKEEPKEETAAKPAEETAGKEGTPPPSDKTASEGEPEPEDKDKKETKSIRERRYDNYIVNLHKSLTGFGRVEGWERARKGMQRGSWKNPLNWPKKIGLRLVQEFFQDNERMRVQKAMLDNDTTMLTMDMAKTAAGIALAKEQGRAVQEATVKRFEEGNLLPGEEPAEEASKELNQLINNEILKPIALGKTTTTEEVRAKLAEFVKAHLDDPQIWKFFGADANNFGEVAEIFATSFLGTGLRIKEDTKGNEEAIKQMVQYVHNKLAVSKAGPQTEKMNLTEKARAWANKRRSRALAQGAQVVGLRGIILNPLVVGAGVTLATSSLLRAVGVAGRIAAVPSFLVGGVGAGAFAGARKYYELGTLDRPMQAIQKTIGEYKKGQQVSPRRDKLDEFSYNMATSNELRNGRGIELISGRERRSGEELLSLDLNAGTPEERQRNIEDIARRKTEILVRYGLSVTLHKDLVGYESRLQSEIAPADDIALSAKLHEKLMQYYRQVVIDAGTEADQVEGKARTNEENLLNRFIKEWNDALITNVEDRDAAFKGYALKEALKAGTFGGILGGGAGIAFQEAFAGIGRGVFHQNIGQTLTESWAGYHPEAPVPPVVGPTPGAIDAFKDIYDHGGKTNIGDHFQATANPDHSLTILDTQTNQPLPDSTHFAIGADGHIKVTGDIPQNLRSELEQKGFKITVGQDIVEGGGDGSVGKPVFGPEGEWTKNATSIDGRVWYAYDQPGSQGNELHEYTFKNGRTLTLDLSTMQQAFQKGLNPNPIDVQEVIRNGQAGFYVSMGDAQSQGLWIPDSADGVLDGKVALNPDDWSHMVDTPGGGISNAELARIIVNQDALQKLTDGNIATELRGHMDVFNLNHGGRVGFIEAGRLTDQNGAKILQTFATIHGNGLAHETITITVPGEAKPPIHTFDITPPEGGPGVPGEPPPSSDAPLLPFVFWPRQPLEDLGKREVPPPPLPVYISGGSRLTEERRKIFEQKKSKTLKEDSNAQLNPYQEEKAYFERQDPQYLTEIQTLASQVTEPPNENLKAVVCIPVAAHEESNNIYSTLKNYTYQNAERDQFEVLLFLNNPKTDSNGNPLSPDKTIVEVERFRKDYPNFPIRVVTKTLTKEEANMGTIRKYLNDIALYRHFQRGSDAGEIILISNDADQKGVAPTYVKNFINRMSNPSTEALLGQLDWDPEAYARYPLVHIGTRLFQYLNAIGRFETGRMPSSGANFAFKGSIYAGVGGYLENISGGEDVALGQAIISARNDPKKIKYAGTRVSRLYTSARRSIDTVNKNLSPIEQWNKEFRALDEDVRGSQLGESQSIDYDDPAEIAKLKTGLEKIINRTLDVYESGEKLGKDSKYYRKALKYLGIEYKFQDGDIIITNMDPLIRGLKHYQKIGVILRDIKAGKGTEESKAELKRLQEEFFKELKDKELQPPIESGERTGHRIKGPAIKTVHREPEPVRKEGPALRGIKAEVKTTRSKAEVEREIAKPEGTWARETLAETAVPIQKVGPRSTDAELAAAALAAGWTKEGGTWYSPDRKRMQSFPPFSHQLPPEYQLEKPAAPEAAPAPAPEATVAEPVERVQVAPVVPATSTVPEAEAPIAEGGPVAEPSPAPVVPPPVEPAPPAPAEERTEAEVPSVTPVFDSQGRIIGYKKEMDDTELELPATHPAAEEPPEIEAGPAPVGEPETAVQSVPPEHEPTLQERRMFGEAAEEMVRIRNLTNEQVRQEAEGKFGPLDPKEPIADIRFRLEQAVSSVTKPEPEVTAAPVVAEPEVELPATHPAAEESLDVEPESPPSAPSGFVPSGDWLADMKKIQALTPEQLLAEGEKRTGKYREGPMNNDLQFRLAQEAAAVASGRNADDIFRIPEVPEPTAAPTQAAEPTLNERRMWRDKAEEMVRLRSLSDDQVKEEAARKFGEVDPNEPISNLRFRLEQATAQVTEPVGVPAETEGVQTEIKTEKPKGLKRRFPRPPIEEVGKGIGRTRGRIGESVREASERVQTSVRKAASDAGARAGELRAGAKTRAKAIREKLAEQAKKRAEQAEANKKAGAVVKEARKLAKREKIPFEEALERIRLGKI